jgi:hypothetical protein
MRHPTIRALHTYWNRLRGSRMAPLRIEIEPRDIVNELGDVFLLEGSAQDFRFRLAGSRMTGALGKMLTGTRFDDLFVEAERARAAKALEATAQDVTPFLIGIRAFDRPAPGEPAPVDTRPGWANFRRLDRFGQPDRRAELGPVGEMILLPLHHAGRDGARILGALALFDPPAIPLTKPRLVAISSTRALGAEARPINGTRLLSGAVARSVIRRRGHLVVMQGFRDGASTADEEAGEAG